jgi:hypothetical protein
MLAPAQVSSGMVSMSDCLIRVGIDQIQISRTAARDQHFANKASKAHIVEADAASATWKRQRLWNNRFARTYERGC